jgi:mono/diheme cytochrome c family protein
VFVYKRGGTAERPPINRPTSPLPQPPVVAASAADVARGAALYSQFCAPCHGAGVVSANVIADLRRSRRLHDESAWQQAVTGGVPGMPAMPRFHEFVTPADASAIRSYVARAAAQRYAEEQQQATGR